MKGEQFLFGISLFLELCGDNHCVLVALILASLFNAFLGIKKPRIKSFKELTIKNMLGIDENENEVLLDL